MAVTTRNTIVLKGDFAPGFWEKRAGGTIKPGHLVGLQTDSEVAVHAAAGVTAIAPVYGVAIEDALQGNTIDDNYSAGDLVFGYQPQPGDIVQLILQSGQDAVVGGGVTSAGDGTVKMAATTDRLLGILEEDTTAAGAVGADTRIAVRWLGAGV
jgi:uncharacterized protein (AIM24 family)